MNTLEAITAINKIATTPGKNDKVDLLTVALSDPDFQEICRYAYDPFTRFYMTSNKMPVLEKSNEKAEDWSKVRYLLDLLSQRKITGTSARATVKEILESQSEESQELFRRIVDKSLKFGCSASSINKARKLTVPEFNVMLAEPIKHKKTGAIQAEFPAAVSPKIDGYRCIAIVDLNDESVEFRSRAGMLFTSCENVKDDMVAAAKEIMRHTQGRIPFNSNTVCVDGEITCGEDINDFKTTSTIMRRDNGHSEHTKFHAFDFFPVEAMRTGDKKGKDTYGKFQNRYNILMNAANPHVQDASRVNCVRHYRVQNMEEAVGKYNDFRAQGYEGAMVKSLDGLYHFRRNKAWAKMKEIETHDLTIVAMEEGERGKQFEGMLGALSVAYRSDEFPDNTVNVASGLTIEQRGKFWGDESLIGRVIEVAAHEESVDSDGVPSLRHPRFIQFRDTPENPGVVV